jgi:signal transduction histidine kinase
MLPSVLFGGFKFVMLPETKQFIIWYLLYWIFVTAAFAGVTAFQKYRSFDKPMNQLSQAAAKVAQGDFTVYLPPVHREGHQDYVDGMFEDFNQMVEELASIETLKSDFISDVSHEIKTPLAVIQNYITALQEPNLPQERRQQYMETIVHSTQRMTELVGNILKLNKLENQKIRPQATTYRLSRQLSDCVLQYEQLLDAKEITVNVAFEERTMVTADESIAELVWNNLLANAVKFSNQGGTIKVQQTTKNDQIVVAISDNGSGMSEETAKHLFDKFYQGDTSHVTEGNGLGMALVKNAVTILGGSVVVESSLGIGTTFTVRLPQAKENITSE